MRATYHQITVKSSYIIRKGNEKINYVGCANYEYDTDVCNIFIFTIEIEIATFNFIHNGYDCNFFYIISSGRYFTSVKILLE